MTTPVASITPLVYRVEEAAEALRISRTAMYELIRSNRIRSFKEGRARLIPVSALHDYLSTAMTESEAA